MTTQSCQNLSFVFTTKGCLLEWSQKLYLALVTKKICTEGICWIDRTTTNNEIHKLTWYATSWLLLRLITNFEIGRRESNKIINLCVAKLMVIEFNKISKRVTKDILFLLLFKVNFCSPGAWQTGMTGFFFYWSHIKLSSIISRIARLFCILLRDQKPMFN